MLPKLENCTVAIIGLGYVGLPLMLEICKKSICLLTQKKLHRRVIGFDINAKRIDELGKGFDRNKIFSNAKKNGKSIKGVIHLAGFKSVYESIEKPLLYYDNNLCGTINLLKCMELHNCKTIVFSSSASIYDQNNYGLINEEKEINPNNPSVKPTVAKYELD